LASREIETLILKREEIKNMQLLFEEFLKKVYRYSKGDTNSLMLILVIRFSIYGFFIGGIGFIVYAIWSGMYYALSVLVGLIIVGEIAHFIRKSRGKSASKKAPKDASMEHAVDVLKKEDSKNKKLLNVGKTKNKPMLKTNKTKNKNLLSKQKALKTPKI